MFSSALNFLLNTLLSTLTMMFLLRFFMQLFKTSFYNQLGQLVITLTDFAVKPARKFIPSWKKIDLSTLFLAFITQFILQLGILWLRDFPFAVADNSIWPSLVGMTLLGAIRATLDLFFYAILLQVILSWVNPHTPIAPVLNALTKPILGPIQRIIPVANGIDFSPVVALILLQMLNISVIAALAKFMLSIY
ncbi:MAG: YggT family protein [Methylophilaceae bacterium]